MNWDVIKGNWKQLQGNFKAQCGRLTNADINVFKGKRDQLAGKLQARYGTAKEVTKKALDDVKRSF